MGQLTAVVVAGGSGTRMGAALPKQYLKLDRLPVLVHTLLQVLELDAQLQVALVLDPRHWHYWTQLGLPHIAAADCQRLLPVGGGAWRTQSVAAGLQILGDWCRQTGRLPGLVLVHDGVRPLAGLDLLSRCLEAGHRSGAAVACVPVKASLRERTETGSRAADRSRFVEVQTPQVFDFQRLYEAYRRRPHDQFTDDASLYETLFPASRIELVEGHYENLKITTRDDLELARRLIRRAAKPAAKTR